jgi:hypothetical protein
MVKRTSLWLAALSLILCLVAPVLHFLGRMDIAGYKVMLASASAGWFIFATAWAMRPKK